MYGLSVCRSVDRLSVRLSVSPWVRKSVCLSVRLSVRPSVCVIVVMTRSVCPSVRLCDSRLCASWSWHTFVRLSVCVSRGHDVVCLSVCLSVCRPSMCLVVTTPVCLSACLWCHNEVSCKNGCTDRDAVWHGVSPTIHVLDAGSLTK